MSDAKKILISVAMFLMAMSATDAQKIPDTYDIDAQIRDARTQIDNARTRRARRVKSALLRNADYVYVVEHCREVDSLRRANQILIDRACDIVRRKNAPRIVVVARTPMVFMLYSSKYYEVSTLRGLYECNCRALNIYQQRLKKIDGFVLRTKNHYDSIMHADIEKYQLMIDSLLNEKIKLIR